MTPVITARAATHAVTGLSDMMSRMRCWVIVLALAAACGPVAYINQVPRDAAGKVDHAKALEAEKWSPYWYTRAVTYLRMAREVAAHADYQGANRFGRLSSEAADKAIADSEGKHSNGPPPATRETVAPAKE
jgi:hypothetical protein